MTEKLFWIVWAVVGIIMLLYYTKRRKPLRSAMFGMATGLASLLLCHFYGEAFGFAPEINMFNTMVALVLGIPGVAVLYLVTAVI